MRPFFDDLTKIGRKMDREMQKRILLCALDDIRPLGTIGTLLDVFNVVPHFDIIHKDGDWIIKGLKLKNEGKKE